MRMNKLNWYDFTVGYLIQAHYDVVKATLMDWLKKTRKDRIIW